MLHLLKQTVSVVGGTGVTTGGALVVSVVIAQVLGPASVGKYGIAQAVSAPVMMFCHMQLRRIVATDSSRRLDLPGCVAFQITSGSVGLAIVYVIAILLYDELVGLIMLTAAQKALEFVSETVYGGMYREGQGGKVGRSMTIQGLAMVLVMTLAVLFSRRLETAVAAACIARAAVFVAYDARGQLGSVMSWSRGGRNFADLVVKLGRLGVPAGLRAAATSSSAAIPRYAIEAISGVQSLGYFVAATQLARLAPMVNEAVVAVMMPRLAEVTGSGVFHRRLGQVCLVSGSIGAVGLAASWLMGETALSLFYGSDFGQHASTLIFLALSAQVSCVIGAISAGFMSLRLVDTEMWATGASLVWLVPLSAFLTTNCGIDGAAMAYGASNAILLTVLILCLKAHARSGSREGS